LHHFGNVIQSQSAGSNALNILQNEELHARVSGYLIFWLVILAAFAVTGFRSFKTASGTSKIDGTGVSCVSDGLLKPPLSISGGSQKLTDAFAQIPSMRPMVFFWPENDGLAIITYQVSSYLAWPRAVWSVPMDEKGLRKAVSDFRNASFSAMIFYSFPLPPDSPHAEKIGIPLSVIPVELPEK